MMENSELMISKNKDVDQSGYSEKKLDQDTDLQAGQWLDLNQGAPKTNKPKAPQASSSKPQSSGDKEQLMQQLTEQVNEHHQLIQAYSKRQEFRSKEAERTLQHIFTLQSSIKSLLQSLKRSS